MESPDYLIVYGTLRPSSTNPSAQFLHQHGRYVGEATFPGLLFDLDWPGASAYPGAIYQPDAATTVAGTVYDIREYKKLIFAHLDDYEGVGEAVDQPHEYVKVVISVTYRDTVTECWVYLYNLSTEGKPIIDSGNYALHCGTSNPDMHKLE